MQTHSYKSIMDCVRKTYAEERLGGFFRGKETEWSKGRLGIALFEMNVLVFLFFDLKKTCRIK